MPRFDYERHVRAVVVEREWPESTRQISELRVVIDYQSDSGAMRTLTLDIVDYPGEWLLDLPLLDKSYEQWSAETIAQSGTRRCAACTRKRFGRGWPASIRWRPPTRTRRSRRPAVHRLSRGLSRRTPERQPDPARPFPDAGRACGFAGAHLRAARRRHRASRRRARNWALMRRRYDAYRDIVVRPFFREHFARLDRQIVLVDLLAALDGGPQAMRDLQASLTAILDCFRVGRGGWLSALFRPSADKILFAATKADQLHHSAHDRLEEILRRLTERAIATAGAAGAEVDVIALAAVRATREAMLREHAAALPSVVGVAVPGPMAATAETFDGETEIGLFPGDLPADVATVLEAERRAHSQLARPARASIPVDPLPAALAGDRRRRHAGAASHSPRPRAAIPDRGPAAMNERPRKPAVFRADDPRLGGGRTGRKPQPWRRCRNRPAILPFRRPIAGAGGRAGARCSGRHCRGLVLLGLGVAITSFVEELFARAPWLGAVGLVLAVLAGIALAGDRVARDYRACRPRQGRGAARAGARRGRD